MIEACYKIEKKATLGPGGDRWLWELSREDAKGNRVVIYATLEQERAATVLSVLKSSDYLGDDSAATRRHNIYAWLFGAWTGVMAAQLAPLVWKLIKPWLY